MGQEEKDEKPIANDLLAKDKINQQLEDEAQPTKSHAQIKMEQDVKASEAARQDNPGQSHDQAYGKVLPFYKVDMSKMAGGGMFYPIGTEIQYRGAGTPEIRKWSSIDENNPKEVYDGIVDILKSTTKGIYWKDLKESDRFKLLLTVQDVSFKEPEQKMHLEFKCDSCAQENRKQLLPDHLRYQLPKEKYMKYHDPERGCLVVTTKSYGSIIVAAPTFGSLELITEWSSKQGIAFIRQNKTFLEIAPMMFESVAALSKITKNGIQGLYEDYCTWDSKKLSVLTTIYDDCKVGMLGKAHMKCNNCKHENAVNVDFKEGIRSFFLPVSNIDSELL